jgi:tetratricopeptide (TPR) repeat protein
MRTALNGDVELLKLRAKCFYEMGDMENSVKHLQQAVRADPDNVEIRNFYRKTRDIEEKKTSGDDFFKKTIFYYHYKVGMNV